MSFHIRFFTKKSFRFLLSPCSFEPVKFKYRIWMIIITGKFFLILILNKLTDFLRIFLKIFLNNNLNNHKINNKNNEHEFLLMVFTKIKKSNLVND